MPGRTWTAGSVLSLTQRLREMMAIKQVKSWVLTCYLTLTHYQGLELGCTPSFDPIGNELLGIQSGFAAGMGRTQAAASWGRECCIKTTVTFPSSYFTVLSLPD